MRPKTWIAAAIAALIALPLLMASGGCFYDHDHDSMDRPVEIRVQTDNDHHDDQVDTHDADHHEDH